MKYAFYPGCVSRGATPELFAATELACDRLGIELEFEPMRSASCTGSGILQEKNLKLADTLNARTFALAEKTGDETARGAARMKLWVAHPERGVAIEAELDVRAAD